MPDEATLGAIRAAAARLAREKPLEMTPQDASMLLWGHVTLGTLTRGTVAEETTSGEETETETEKNKDPFLDALYSALDRHVDAFKPDELTNALWCLAVARGVGPSRPRGNRDRDHKNAPLPGAAYARMWRRLATMEANDFATEDGVLIAHHAAVTHNALLAESNDEDVKREAVTFFPPEGRAPTPRPSLVAAAEKAWRAQNAQHENYDALSSSQRRVGTLLRRAGIPHESEKELAGGFGFFPATQTVDFFLTDSRVVVEYDGPHHYYETAADPRRERFFRSDDDELSTPDQALARGDPGATRNVNTRLRDALLARKEVTAVVTVPWWAMRGVKHADQEKWLVERIEAVAQELSAPSAPNKTCRRIRQTLIKRWLEASPASSRAKLERDLSVAGKDDDARWAAVVAAASKDAAKVRAKLRGEIVEAVERRA